MKIDRTSSACRLRQPKAVPKRIDQNANRVIKSSSMDAPKAHSISETFTTSTKETKLVSTHNWDENENLANIIYKPRKKLNDENADTDYIMLSGNTSTK